MNNEKDIEYLSRPLIAGAEYTTENGYIRVSFPCTIFAEARYTAHINRAEIMALYTSVFCKARTQNIRILYKKYMHKKIAECWTEYESEYAKAADIFNRIDEQVKVIRERGIHYGTTDDAELDRLYDLIDKYQKFFMGNGIISEISSIYRSLKEIEKDLNSPDSQLCQIYL